MSCWLLVLQLIVKVLVLLLVILGLQLAWGSHKAHLCGPVAWTISLGLGLREGPARINLTVNIRSIASLSTPKEYSQAKILKGILGNPCGREIKHLCSCTTSYLPIANSSCYLCAGYSLAQRNLAPINIQASVAAAQLLFNNRVVVGNPVSSTST